MTISRVWRTALAVVLVICMAIGFVPVSAFAASEKLNYVSIGDSMSNGFALGNGYGSTNHDGFNEICTKAYPYLVAEHYGWNLTQLATSGLRSEDLHYILEAGQPDAYPADDYTNDLLSHRWKGTWNGKDAAGVFQDAVKNADVISLALGNANFGVYLMSMLGELDSDTYAYATLDNAVKLLSLEGDLKDLVYDLYDELVAYLSLRLPKKLAETIADRVAYVATSYMYNVTGSLNAIAALNPDVEIVMVGMMNNMSGCEMEITYQGKTNMLDFAEMLDLLINPLNLYLAGMPTYLQTKEAYADVAFYYAELDRIECLGTTFKDDFDNDRAFYLSRFVPDLTSLYFPIFGLDENTITWQNVYDYLQKGSSAVSEDKIVAVELYLMLQELVLNSMEQKPSADLDALSAMNVPESAILSVGEVTKYAIASQFDLSKDLTLDDLPVLKEILSNNGTVIGLMSYYGRSGLADGMSSHPTAKTHVDMKNMIVSSYDAKYTAQEETIIKVGKLLDKAYNDPNVQAAIAKASSGKVRVENSFKYVALGDGTAAASGYPELLKEKLAAEAAAINVRNVEFKNLAKAGNTVAKTMANLPADVADANLITLGFSQAEMLGSALAGAINGQTVEADWIGLLGEEAMPYVDKALGMVREKLAAMELDASLADMMDQLVESYAYSAAEFAVRLPELVRAIREVNKDAEIVVVGMYNPLQDVVIDAMGVKLDLSSMGGYFDYVVDIMYAYCIVGAIRYNSFDYVEARDVKIQKSNWGLKEMGALMSGDVSMLYPNADGEVYIAEQLDKALTVVYGPDEPAEEPILPDIPTLPSEPSDPTEPSEPEIPVKPAEPLAAPVVEATTDPVTGGALLTWEAVEGADSYEVYRATSSKGKYTLVDTVTEAEAVVSVAVGKTYYFKIKAICAEDAELNSDYSKVVKATGKCAQPEITTEVKASTGKPVIKWSKVTSAKKYTVYRATSEDGKYTALKTVTTTSYTDTSAKLGTTYFYKVKALGSKSTYNSVDSAIKSCTVACAQPALTVKVDAATGKAALSWKKITGAASYDIYRATAADGEFEKIANQTAVSYKDLDAAANTDYWYKVQAIAEDEALNSADSAVKKAHTTLAKPVVTFAVDDASGKPMLTWEEVEGAVEYQVYRSTKSTSSYKKVNTTTDLTYTDTSVGVAKGYYYKVIAVGENVKSAYSAYKKLTAKCAQPVVTLDVNDNGQPVLKWEKVAGAKKYTIYRTDETGEEVSLGTTTKLTYTDKKAAEGATYTYRVRANGSKSAYNSTYSEPVSCAFDATKPVLNTKLLDLGGKNLAEISAVLGEYTQVENYYWFDQGNVAYVFTYGEDMGSNYIQGSLKCVLDHCPETVSEKQLKNYFPGGETVYDAMNDFDCFAWDYRNCTLVILPDSNGKYTADSIIYYNCDMLVPIPPAAGEWGSTDGNNKAAVTVTGITDTELVCAFLYEQMNAPYRINETEIVTLTSQDGVTYTASGVQDSWENVWNVTVTIQTRSAVVTWECTQVGPMANFSFSDFTVFW